MHSCLLTKNGLIKYSHKHKKGTYMCLICCILIVKVMFEDRRELLATTVY